MLNRNLVLVIISLLVITITQISAQEGWVSLKKKDIALKTPDNFYFNTTWQKGEVELNTSKKLQFDSIKYNLKSELLEFKEEDGVYVLPLKEVRSILFTEIDVLLTCAYSKRKKIQTVDDMSKIESFFSVKKESPTPTPKACYINEYWQSANIIFDRNKTLDNALIKINLKDNNIELKKLETVLTLPISRVNQILLPMKKETLFSLKKYDNSSTELLGLLSILYTKSGISLASNYNLRVILPSGSASYGTTKSNKPSYKMTSIFIFINKKNKLFRIDKKTKKNSYLFGEHWENILIFIKKEKLSFKTKEGIIRIIDFYSDLLNV